MFFLKVDDVIQIHDDVIRSDELQGLAGGKSIEAVIGRIDNRISYGLIADVFELAACYVFNDANKRTAFVAMDICHALNGLELEYETIEAGDKIRKVAQNSIDEVELAEWLRSKNL
ncbi:MAG: type II toxin-antitoxin system death-on-curing family toxin [Pseudomonadales bacterium]|nr:type II toxin-antitoxin system death-on-curing family toxin [Pseudomonadales bacterium]